MTMISFGDLAQSFLLKSQTARLKADSIRTTQELASGKISDLGAAVAGDFTQLSAIARERSLTMGFRSAAQEASSAAQAGQTTLASISQSARALISPMVAASQSALPDQLSLVGQDARARMADVLNSLNGSVGGRSLFAGDTVSGPAVADADVVFAAVRTAVASATTAQGVLDDLTNWFDSPSGYPVIAYLGGASLQPVAVSATDQVALDLTALDPAFRTALKAFAAATLVDDTTLSLPFSERQTLAQKGAEALLTGLESLTNAAARLGLAESRIETATSRNSADLLALELAEANITQSDPYRLATELEAIQTNLEMVYSITARLSRLTLTDFLR